MAQQGAALQTYNNELVKCLEELCEREIDKEHAERKAVLDSQLIQLTAKINAMDASLARKLQTKEEYDKTIRESEEAYMKILESSQVLLNVVKKDTMNLQKAEQAVSKNPKT